MTTLWMGMVAISTIITPTTTIIFSAKMAPVED